MGTLHRKKLSPRIAELAKLEPEFGTAGTPSLSGCPGSLRFTGRQRGVENGQDATIVLAQGQLQLIVGDRVIENSNISGSQDFVSECLRIGESYYGSVVSCDDGEFVVELARVEA